MNHSPNMQTKVTKLHDYAAKAGLKVNTKKTEVLRINAKSNNRTSIGDEVLNEVDKSTCLGAIVSKQGGRGQDIANRINKAKSSFIKLRLQYGAHPNTISRPKLDFTTYLLNQYCYMDVRRGRLMKVIIKGLLTYSTSNVSGEF